MSDNELLSPEQLAEALSVSRSFVRLILDAGAPQIEGRARLADVVNWTLNNNAKVRALAGLSELPPIPAGASSQDAASIKVRYHLQTVLEYQAARTQDPGLKEAMFEQVERISGEDFPPVP